MIAAAERSKVSINLPHRVLQPGGDADPMGRCGLLHLLEQVGFYQHVYELRAIGDREVNRPSRCVGEAP